MQKSNYIFNQVNPTHNIDKRLLDNSFLNEYHSLGKLINLLTA
jgi:hypothetical protein